MRLDYSSRVLEYKSVDHARDIHHRLLASNIFLLHRQEDMECLLRKVHHKSNGTLGKKSRS